MQHDRSGEPAISPKCFINPTQVHNAVELNIMSGWEDLLHTHAPYSSISSFNVWAILQPHVNVIEMICILRIRCLKMSYTYFFLGGGGGEVVQG